MTKIHILLITLILLLSLFIIGCSNDDSKPDDANSTKSASTESNSYPNYIQNASTNIGNCLSDLSEINLEIASDESLLNDEDWQFNATSKAQEIILYCKGIIEYKDTVPADFVDAHEAYVKGCTTLKDAMAIYMNGVDNTDLTLIDKASTELEKATKEISDAADIFIVSNS